MRQAKPRATRETTEPGRAKGDARLTLFTIGHSNHDAGRLLGLLRARGVDLVADVRRFPGSARWPQFSQERLEATLNAGGITYLWLPALGGRRRLRDEDPADAGWQQAGFRAYAAHMRSKEFESGLASLIAAARDKRAALMCAEGLWWQCHRRLIADKLLVRGCEVMHIMPDGRLTRHVLTPFAAVRDGRLAYPAPAQRGLFGAS